jgi:hypothetical protein
MVRPWLTYRSPSSSKTGVGRSPCSRRAAPGLYRDEALEILDQLKAALLEVGRLRALVGGG